MVEQITPQDSTPRRKKRPGPFFLLVSFFLLLLLGTWGWYLLYTKSPGPESDVAEVLITIPRGASVRDIRGILADKKLINSDIRFLLLARISGLGGRLQAGEFLLPTGAVPGEILRILATSKPVEYKITIPEGLYSGEIAAIFAKDGWCDPKRFSELIVDKKLIEQLDMQGLTSLEGYLFPDTYLLIKQDKGAEKLITMMVHHFQEVWGQLSENSEIPLEKRHRTVVLASMVEKEAAVSKERARIAGVFENRLKIGMRLQSDPTVSFGLKKFDSPLSRKDLRTPTPYNTYTLPELPAGPICNPGEAALEAVLHPEKTADLYFVARNDGTHQFSRSLVEHNRAVRKYQRKKNRGKGK